MRHSRLVAPPAQSHFPPFDQGGKVHYPQLPVAKLNSDIFDLFQADADTVGGADQLVAGLFNLAEAPGGLQGLESLVYFHQPIVVDYYVSNYSPDEHQRAVGLFQREKVSYSPFGRNVFGDIV